MRSNQRATHAGEHRSGERRLLEIIEDQIDRALQTSHQVALDPAANSPDLDKPIRKQAETAGLLLNKRAGRMQSDRDRQGNWRIVSDKAMIHGPSHGEGHERPGLGDGRGHDDKLDESSTMPGRQTAASTLDGPDQNSSGTSPSLPPFSYFLAAFPPDAVIFGVVLATSPFCLASSQIPVPVLLGRILVAGIVTARGGNFINNPSPSRLHEAAGALVTSVSVLGTRPPPSMRMRRSLMLVAAS